MGPTPIGGGLLAAADGVEVPEMECQDSSSLIRPVLGLLTEITAQSVGTATISAIPIGTISTTLLENGGIADHQVPSCDW